MTNEALVKEIAERAGFAPRNLGKSRGRFDWANKPINAVVLPHGLARAAVDRLHWMELGIEVDLWSACPDHSIDGPVWLRLSPPVGHRTAARRFLRLLQTLAAQMEAAPDAEWRLVDLGHRAQFQIVGQGLSEADLSAAIAGQI